MYYKKLVIVKGGDYLESENPYVYFLLGNNLSIYYFIRINKMVFGHIHRVNR